MRMDVGFQNILHKHTDKEANVCKDFDHKDGNMEIFLKFYVIF